MWLEALPLLLVKGLDQLNIRSCSAQSAIFTRARAVMAFDDIARSENNTRKDTELYR